MNNRFFASVALLFAVVTFFAYINPLWNGSIAETKVAIAQDDKALASAKEYKDRQEELRGIRDAIDPAALERLNKFLPDSVDNVGLILDLNALAARSGLALSSINVSEDGNGMTSSSGGLSSADVNPVGSIDLTISAVGTYAAFQTFLQGVERSQRLLDVRDLTVTGSSSGLYNYKMSVRIYWLR